MLLGIHVKRHYSKDNKIISAFDETIKDAKNYGITLKSAQFYLSSPLSLHVLKDRTKINTLRQYINTHNIIIIDHMPYTIVPWTKYETKRAVMKKSLNNVIY
jgi:hypothetical protein